MADYGQQDYDRHRQMTVGYVLQDFNLLEGLTLKENIILPLTLQKVSETKIQQKYADTLRYVDVSYCENNYPEQSSGGEQQNQSSASHSDFWSDIAIRCGPIWLLPGGNKDIGQTILKLVREDRILWIFQKNYRHYGKLMT